MRTGALCGLSRRRWVSPQRGLPAHEALRVATRTPPRHNLYWNLPLNHLLLSGVPSTAGPNPPGFRGRPQPVRKPPRQARSIYCHPWSFGGHCQLFGLYPLARSFPRRPSLPGSAAAAESGALAARGGSTFSELRWYPPVEAAKGSLSWVFRAKQPESVRTGP